MDGQRDERPDPELLLKQNFPRESDKARGRLKIFFGYAAGVGKTYAMLEAARQEKAAGRDVVAGYIEPHDAGYNGAAGRNGAADPNGGNV